MKISVISEDVIQMTRQVQSCAQGSHSKAGKRGIWSSDRAVAHSKLTLKYPRTGNGNKGQVYSVSLRDTVRTPIPATTSGALIQAALDHYY